MKILKDELFFLIENLTGDNASVYLHGIADNSDNLTKFDKLTKIEKAQNICKKGLNISGNRRLAYTAMGFGNLSDTYEQEKMYISRFNGYNYNSANGEIVTVIVAIPIVFEDSKGRKLFNGWDRCVTDISSSREINCGSIAYYLQEGRILPEFILGYVVGSVDNNQLEFIENVRYYGKLSKEEQDAFINDFFDKSKITIDLESTEDLNEQIMHLNLLNELKLKLCEQIRIYKSSEFLEKQKQRAERRKSYDIKNPYTINELETIPIDLLDISRIKPNVDMVIQSKYKITGDMLTANPRAGITRSLMDAVGYKPKEDSWLILRDFEEFIKSKGNNLNDLYKLWYIMYKYEYDRLFKENIAYMKKRQNQKEKEGLKNRNNEF